MHTKRVFGIWLLLSAGLYIWLLYLTPRAHFMTLFLLFGGLFALYLLWFPAPSRNRLLPADTSNHQIGLWILGGGILLRLIAAGALPNLSDDYFRFIWDGFMWQLGENPFQYLPATLIESGHPITEIPLSEALFEGMNSPRYFTIYPPVLQAIFWLGAWLSPNSIQGAVWIMKLPVLIAEAATIWLLLRMLPTWGLARHQAAWYAFNPLVIAELSGNLHFEALMIFFSLWSIYWLQNHKWWISALVFSLAICCKLLPLMWLPLLIRRLGWGKAFLYGLIAGFATLLQFVPIFDWATLQHLSESVGLYFQTFEFNASLWYILRAIGYQLIGYNIIQMAGPYMALATMGCILLFSFLEPDPDLKSLPKAMLWTLSIYFLLASIVHPWYLTSLVLFSVFTSFRWAFIWSFLAILSYATYAVLPYQESLWLVGVEYGLVFLWGLWELFKHRSTAN